MIIAPLLFTTNTRKVGQFVALQDCQEGDDIEIFRNGASFITEDNISLSSILFTPVYKYFTTVAGTYKFRRIVGGEVSEFSSEILVEAFVVAAPTVSAITGTVGVNLTVSNLANGDILKVYRSNTVGSVDTLTISGTSVAYAPPSPGTYSFKIIRGLDESAFSVDVVVVSVVNQLADLAITGLGQIFVNDAREILGLASGATLVIRLNNLPTVAGTDYETLSNGYLKFLKAGDFSIWQTKVSYVDSTKLLVNIAEGLKPNLPTPTLSSNNVLVNGTVTVTNYASYDNIELKKGLSTAVLGGDYTKVLGVITFLNVGTYRVFGYKLNHNNSDLSAAIDVTDIGTTNTEKTIEIGFDDLGGNKVTDLEFGFAEPLASPTTWYSAFENGVKDTIPYARIKTIQDLTITTLLFARVKNEAGTQSDGKVLS